MLLAQVLARLLGEGQLTIIDAVGRPHRIEGARPGPSVTLRVHSWWTGVRVALRPRLALGEAYMDGTLTVEEGGDIYDLLDLLGRNIAALEATPMVRLSYTLQRWLRVLEQYNPIGKAQRNVAHHYDLNGQLYDFFLDRDRQYSCAYFKTGEEPLEQAQLDKKRHIAAKLLLKPGQKRARHRLGLGRHGPLPQPAVRRRRDGRDALQGTARRLEPAGAGRRRGRHACASSCSTIARSPARYDRIVSVGMFEHVGVAHYIEFFTKVKELLADDGVMLLHSIGRMEPPGRHQHLAAQIHLPRRLHAGHVGGADGDREGRAVGHRHRGPAAALRTRPCATGASASSPTASSIKQMAGYDDRFCRMWEFYLAGCEVAFRYMNQMVFQIQIARRQDAVPLTRDYHDRCRERHQRAELDGGRVTIRGRYPRFQDLSICRKSDQARPHLRW